MYFCQARRSAYAQEHPDLKNNEVHPRGAMVVAVAAAVAVFTTSCFGCGHDFTAALLAADCLNKALPRVVL